MMLVKGGRVIGCCSRSRKVAAQSRAQSAVLMHAIVADHRT